MGTALAPITVPRTYVPQLFGFPDARMDFPASQRSLWKGQHMFNEGSLDRALRVILGIAILSLVFFGPTTAWGWLGVVPLVTGLVGMCPLYSLLGIRTNRRSR
jgi:hypothetical protein